MKTRLLTLKITENINDFSILNIKSKIDSLDLMYSPKTKEIKYLNSNKLSDFLKLNEAQFRKILNTKSHNSFYEGFKLDFVLTNLKDVNLFNDYSRIIVLDKRKYTPRCYTLKNGRKKIYKIFTDGCYLYNYDRGGYAVIIQNLNNKYSIYSENTDEKSSNLIELQAVIKGLYILKNEKYIRIITDSKYVIKGLTEWIINWKLNNWYTANGVKVKNIDYWKEYDGLTEGKYIEYKWVKAHSDHFENSLCDIYAREASLKK